MPHCDIVRECLIDLEHSMTQIVKNIDSSLMLHSLCTFNDSDCQGAWNFDNSLMLHGLGTFNASHCQGGGRGENRQEKGGMSLSWQNSDKRGGPNTYKGVPECGSSLGTFNDSDCQGAWNFDSLMLHSLCTFNASPWHCTWMLDGLGTFNDSDCQEPKTLIVR
jgi:hypothetical protein